MVLLHVRCSACVQAACAFALQTAVTHTMLIFTHTHTHTNACGCARRVGVSQLICTRLRFSTHQSFLLECRDQACAHNTLVHRSAAHVCLFAHVLSQTMSMHAPHPCSTPPLSTLTTHNKQQQQQQVNTGEEAVCVWMYGCICMYVWMCVCLYVYMYVCMYVCGCMDVWMYGSVLCVHVQPPPA